jgi:antitoxin component of MazEF toxin-antitoxin module
MDASIRKIIRVGNSLGVTLPSEMIEQLDIKLSEEMEVQLENGKLVLIPLETRRVRKQIASEKRDGRDER